MSYKPTGIDCSGGKFVIKQAKTRKKYRVLDQQGTEVLRTKQKWLRMKEEFPITNAEGQRVAHVEAGGVVDVAGDYTLIDDVRGVELFVFDKNLTLTLPKWDIRDAQTGEVVVSVVTTSGLRRFFLPTYSVVAPNGDELGTIKQRASLLSNTIDVDVRGLRDNGLREAVVIGAMVIDALEPD